MTAYGLIGDGRLATSLASWLPAHGCTVHRWSRRAERAGGMPLAGVLRHCHTVLIAIRDDAIVPWTETHRALLTDKTLIHFSGALVAPGISALHPLYAFPPEAVPVDRLNTVAFVGDEGGASFSDVFPDLPNPHFAVAPAKRPLYHAFAVLSGNLATFLWNETAKGLWDELGLPPQAVLNPYFRGLIDNFDASPFDSLTGPVKRGDLATIRANLEALETQPRLHQLYMAFVRAAQASNEDPLP